MPDLQTLRRHVAFDIWAHTGGEGECPDDGQYEPCEACLTGIFLPAADAVIATVAEHIEWVDGERG